MSLWRGTKAVNQRVRLRTHSPICIRQGRLAFVVENPHPTEVEALIGNDAVHHLRHHGIHAVKYRAVGEEDEIADALIKECRTRCKPAGDG